MVKTFTSLVISFFLSCYALPSMAAHWTVMVYMAGDNNLAEAAIEDIEEMMKVGSSAEVNIVVQVDLSPIYVPQVEGRVHRLFIKKDNFEDFPLETNLDSADPQVLRDFIEWAVANYPAEHYALVLWDHGAGWKFSDKAIFTDDTSGDLMNLNELVNALQETTVHFDVVDFDACLMGMYEVAYAFKNVASYLVFSEQTEPPTGDPYDLILSTLVHNPHMSASDLAKEIVEDYYTFYAQRADSAVTKSACDLSQIDQLHSLLSAFVAQAKPKMSQLVPLMNQALTQVQSYKIPSYKDLYDLLDHFNQVFNDWYLNILINRILNFLRTNVVIANRVYDPPNEGVSFLSIPSVANSHGLSIYFPSGKINPEELEDYSQLAVNQGENSWYALIKDFIECENVSEQNFVQGGFSWAILWLDANGYFPSWADVDLYIIEPCSNCEGEWDIYAPYMGLTTPNGFFSPDSFDSGISYEVYTAADTIIKGRYLAIAHLNCYSYWDYAYTYFLIKDPLNGLSEWTVMAEKELSCFFPAPPPEEWDENVVEGIIRGDYTNWWVIYGEERTYSPRSKTEIGLSLRSKLHEGH